MNVDARSGIPPTGATPRARQQLDAVAVEKPKGWEYLYFAGNLLLGMADVDQHRSPAAAAVTVSEQDAIELASAQFQGLGRAASRVEPIFAAKDLERAFGRPRKPGSASDIAQLAARILVIYQDVCSVGDGLAAVRFPPDLSKMQFLSQEMVDTVIAEFRQWVADMVGVTDRVHEATAQHPIRYTSILKLEMPDGVVREFNQEVGRVGRRLGSKLKRMPTSRRSGCCGCTTALLIFIFVVIALMGLFEMNRRCEWAVVLQPEVAQA